MNRKVLHFKELGSTNDYAVRHIDSLADRDVILADIQTQGKGKYGRVWISNNPNNMYLSIVLKQDPNLASKLPKLTLFSASIVADFIEKSFEQTNHQVQLRKPNDVLIDHAKLAGILADASWMGNQPQYAIIGIGVNLNMSSHELSLIDQASTSLNLVCGKPICKVEFIDKFLNFFFFNLDAFLKLKSPPDPGSDYFQRYLDFQAPSQYQTKPGD